MLRIMESDEFANLRSRNSEPSDLASVCTTEDTRVCDGREGH